MSLEDNVVNRISRLFERKTTKTSPYDTQAVVKRVEGKTAWVHIPGGVAETPVKMTVDAKPGDTVMVRISGGKGWIIGNETSPPSNDKADVAKKMNSDMSGRKKHIVIKDGTIKFVGKTLIIESDNFKLDEDGNASFKGDLNGTSLTVKDYISIYNGDDKVRVISFDKSEPVPGVKSFMIEIDPDGIMPYLYIKSKYTACKALNASDDYGTFSVCGGDPFFLEQNALDANWDFTPNRVRVFQSRPAYDGAHVYLYSDAINDISGSGSTVVIDGNGRLLTSSSSSKRYKHDIRDIDIDEVLPLLDLHVRRYKYNEKYLVDDDERVGKDIPGFIAEEVEDILPIAVNHNPDGSAEMWNEQILVPCLLKLIQYNNDRIKALETELEALKEKTNG